MLKKYFGMLLRGLINKFRALIDALKWLRFQKKKIGENLELKKQQMGLSSVFPEFDDSVNVLFLEWLLNKYYTLLSNDSLDLQQGQRFFFCRIPYLSYEAGLLSNYTSAKKQGIVRNEPQLWRKAPKEMHSSNEEGPPF